MKTSTVCFVLLSLVPLPVGAAELFLTSDNCMACHNGMSTPSGGDVSFGIDWRPTMMANSARDPYWQASVRRESREHAPATAAIENECSVCHMPMAHVESQAAGRMEKVFANLGRGALGARAALAQDGVSCAVCHQIEADRLGRPESFVGGFVVDTGGKRPRKAMGPYEVKPALAHLMASATNFSPTSAAHVRSSELCATCHTLITEALDADGKTIGRLPEQVPYQEWLESSYRESRSCSACHMPEIREPVPMANLVAEPRTGLGRHEFVGGNFIVPAMLKRLGAALPALPQDLDRATLRARNHLADAAANLSIGEIAVQDATLSAEIRLDNLAGHKLPTAYPSRRSWLHVSVRDGQGRIFFESGAVTATGRIVGNDNDDDPSRFESHHAVIEKPEQVQIYEAILGDKDGRVTTGLLHAVKYLKDNRVPPLGFDKQKAPADVAVHGESLADADFVGGSDRVMLRIPVGERQGPYQVQAELLYQPIGYRWADNLRAGGDAEAKVFPRAFDGLAAVSFQTLVRAERVAGN
jgi:hypothetical protein